MVRESAYQKWKQQWDRSTVQRKKQHIVCELLYKASKLEAIGVRNEGLPGSKQPKLNGLQQMDGVAEVYLNRVYNTITIRSSSEHVTIAVSNNYERSVFFTYYVNDGLLFQLPFEPFEPVRLILTTWNNTELIRVWDPSQFFVEQIEGLDLSEVVEPYYGQGGVIKLRGMKEWTVT